MTTQAASLPAVRLRLPRGVALGIALAFAAALVSGFSIWVNSYAVKEVRDPAVFTTAKNVTVGVLFAAMLLLSRRRSTQSVRSLSTRQRLTLIGLGIVGGSIPFVLFFEGLSQSGPGNAAFIQKTLFLWVAVLALPLLRERLTPWQLFGLAMLLVAQYLVGKPGTWDIGRGEAMVLAATGFWAVEAVIARALLPGTSSFLGASARMGFGGAILLVYLTLTGKVDELASLSGGQWAWVVGTSAILAVYVSTWYAALKHAPATVVTSVLTVAAPITAALSAWSGTSSPSSGQLVGYALLLAVAVAIAALAATQGQRATNAGPAEVIA